MKHRLNPIVAVVLMLAVLTMAFGNGAAPATPNHEPPSADPESLSSTGQTIRQWAVSATSSSEYGTSAWSANSATGAPDAPSCGDSGNAWASTVANTVEWLELRYDSPVTATQVAIVQNYNPSQVVKVELLDHAGTYHEVYSGKPKQIAECPYTLTIPVKADYQADGVKITVDQSVLGVGWNEIDAVELVGVGAPRPTPQELGWSVFSNANYVEDLEYHDGTLWAATQGGVVGWDVAADKATKYTTLDGLAHNVVHAIVACPVPEPRIVAGTELGLSVLNPDTGRWEELRPAGAENVQQPNVAALACVPQSKTLLIGYLTAGLHSWNTVTNEWKHYDESTGLGDDMVQAIGVVGNMKQIWTGTPVGGTVSVISDAGVKVYTEADTEMLKSTSIVEIVPDAQGSVWMGQFIDEALIRFKDGQWTAYDTENVKDMPMGGASGGIALADDGTLWLVSGFGGVCHFDPKTEQCLQVYEDQPGQVGFPAESVVLGAQGAIYYGNSRGGEGISAFDGKSWRTLLVKDDQLAVNEVQGLAVDHDGKLWLGTDTGSAQRLDPANPQAAWQRFADDLPSLAVNAFAVDASGGVWAGHGAGASYYDGAQWTHYGKDQGILPDVKVLAVSGQGQVWFGTTNGLSVWDGKAFTTLTKENGNLPGNYVRAMLADGDVVWVGVWGSGLLRFEKGKSELYNTEKGLPNNNISALALDADGSLLIGADAELVRLDKAGDVAPVFTAQGWPSLITSIVVGKAGHLWLGTLFDGAYHFDGRDWRHLTTADGLPTNQFQEGAVVMDRQGGVWFGGAQGGLAHWTAP